MLGRLRQQSQPYIEIIMSLGLMLGLEHKTLTSTLSFLNETITTFIYLDRTYACILGYCRVLFYFR